MVVLDLINAIGVLFRNGVVEENHVSRNRNAASPAVQHVPTATESPCVAILGEKGPKGQTQCGRLGRQMAILVVGLPVLPSERRCNVSQASRVLCLAIGGVLLTACVADAGLFSSAPSTQIRVPSGKEAMGTPQPEPPMLPAACWFLMPGQDAVKLSPQPEPPDYPKDMIELLFLMEYFSLFD